MREWLCVALAATSLACSGGRDPVRTVGGGREYEGPGASDPSGEDSDFNEPTVSTAPLIVLCTKACAHLHAKDCEGAPAHTTDTCEGQCTLATINLPTRCWDEAAAVHACSMNAKITCSGMLGDQPVVNGCDDPMNELEMCLTPGTACVVSPKTEEVCLSLGLPLFLICSEGIEPPEKCLEIATDAFCCP